MYLTIEVEDVDKIYREIREKELEVKVEIRDEPWGESILPLKIRMVLALM